MNNYVPIVLMSMLSNMDFQATLTKDAVIEYMTKYMTKAGQGSLVHVMEHSFAACLEKAQEAQQGSGSAILRWFNLQSITEVKSQLETMHLLFGVPRFLCSREFKDLYLRSEIQMAKTPQQIRDGASTQEPIAGKSGAEIYVQRHIWELPRSHALLQPHPITRTPWWQEILTTVFIHSESPRLCQGSMDAAVEDITRAWPTYLRLMSWWQLKRFSWRAGPRVPPPSRCGRHPSRWPFHDGQDTRTVARRMLLDAPGLLQPRPGMQDDLYRRRTIKRSEL
jgi:hypothetical protein